MWKLFYKSKSSKKECVRALDIVENNTPLESTNQNQQGDKGAYVFSHSYEIEHLYRSLDDDYEEINDCLEMNSQNHSDYEKPVSKDTSTCLPFNNENIGRYTLDDIYLTQKTESSSSYAAISDILHNRLTLRHSTENLMISCSELPDDYLKPVFANHPIKGSSVIISDNYRNQLTKETNTESLNPCNKLRGSVNRVCNQHTNRCSKRCSKNKTTRGLNSCSEILGNYLYPVHDEESGVSTRMSENYHNLPTIDSSDYLSPVCNERTTRHSNISDENTDLIITEEDTLEHCNSCSKMSSSIYLYPVCEETNTGDSIISDSCLKPLNKADYEKGLNSSVDYSCDYLSPICDERTHGYSNKFVDNTHDKAASDHNFKGLNLCLGTSENYLYPIYDGKSKSESYLNQLTNKITVKDLNSCNKHLSDYLNPIWVQQSTRCSNKNVKI